MGHDFSGVRVHADARAAGAASALAARAFTVGDDIVFGAGEYAHHTDSGRRLLSHELAHVMQQRGGNGPGPGLSRRGDAYERQANEVAAHVTDGRSFGGALGRWPNHVPAALRHASYAGASAWPIQCQVAEGAKAAPLTNPLFAGDAVLQSVRDGKTTIASGKGPHILKIQTALTNLGYSLPISGADSGFGKETASALGQFQQDHGLAVSEAVDAPTMVALDKNAPASPLTKYPEYAKLFGDGLLDFTVAVGYDEDGTFDDEIQKPAAAGKLPTGIIPELKNRRFEKKTAKDAEKVYAKAGMTMPATAGGSYYIKTAALTYETKQIDVIVRLITYKDPDVRKAFLEAMQTSDVTLYTGHGRYGSGPDFDINTSGAGNVLINPNPTVPDAGTKHMYEELKRQKVKQALPGMSFDQKYKIWFFDGCNTKHYMRSIRKLAKAGTSKTDVFGWGRAIPADTTAEDVISFIDGLIAMQSAQELIDNLNKINKVNPAKPSTGAGAEGMGDNPNTK